MMVILNLYAVEGRFKAKNSYVVWDCSQNSTEHFSVPDPVKDNRVLKFKKWPNTVIDPRGPPVWQEREHI